MAQSRMAGMAMDLGPSDLADVGEAATLATNKMGMEQGQQATVIHNLNMSPMVTRWAWSKVNKRVLLMI